MAKILVVVIIIFGLIGCVKPQKPVKKTVYRWKSKEPPYILEPPRTSKQ